MIGSRGEGVDRDLVFFPRHPLSPHNAPEEKNLLNIYTKSATQIVIYISQFIHSLAM